MTDVGFTADDMAEAHKLVRAIARRTGYTPTEDHFQEGTIAYWRTKQRLARRAEKNTGCWFYTSVRRALISADRKWNGRIGCSRRAAKNVDFHGGADQFVPARDTAIHDLDTKDMVEVARNLLKGSLRRIIDGMLADKTSVQIALALRTTESWISIGKRKAFAKMRESLEVGGKP